MDSNSDKEKWFLKQVKRGRLKVCPSGSIINTKTGNTFSNINSRGYINVALKDIDVGKVKNIQAHRLVWLAFKGLIKDKTFEINHIDGNKTNNNISNLELVSRSSNMCHARDNHLLKNAEGTNNPNAKLTKNQVIKIRKMFCNGCTQKYIANALGLNKWTVHEVVRFKTYKT